MTSTSRWNVAGAGCSIRVAAVAVSAGTGLALNSPLSGAPVSGVKEGSSSGSAAGADSTVSDAAGAAGVAVTN